MKYLITFALAVALHLTLGWAWTVGAGVFGGFWMRRHGWLVGAVGVGGGWAALAAYSFVVASGPTAAMARTMGGILGNLPGPLVVVATVLIGAVLGAAGGFVGTQGRRLFWAADRRRAAAS